MLQQFFRIKNKIEQDILRYGAQMEAISPPAAVHHDATTEIGIIKKIYR